jgi:hypothetical protein
MKRIMAVSVLALGLAGCNATVYGPRPVIDVYTPAPYPVARPYHHVERPLFVAPRPRCFTTWDRTPYGLRERRVCH